jgi:hypothetical protein
LLPGLRTEKYHPITVLVKIVRLRSEIRTWDLMCTKQECQPLNLDTFSGASEYQDESETEHRVFPQCQLPTLMKVKAPSHKSVPGNGVVVVVLCVCVCVGWCIQMFPHWPPGARTANGTALYH